MNKRALKAIRNAYLCTIRTFFHLCNTSSIATCSPFIHIECVKITFPINLKGNSIIIIILFSLINILCEHAPKYYSVTQSGKTNMIEYQKCWYDSYYWWHTSCFKIFSYEIPVIMCNRNEATIMQVIQNKMIAAKINIISYKKKVQADNWTI